MQKNFAQADYAATARQAAAEGAVLLRNYRHALPLEEGCRVAVFGRNQLHYYRCGIGSGGMVNSAYVVSILDALKADSDIVLNQAVLSAYEAWHEAHPLEGCNEWGEEPWSQAEMPLPEALVQQAAKTSDAALICIGRTAGEDHDSSAAPGSFLLTEEEERTIRLVCRYFPRSIVVLNTAGIIDMTWVKRCNPAAILYVWHGGQEGGNGAADVLTGRVNPCGKLPDTIAEQLSDYPANANFGNAERNFYAEDIFLGYRYFETFAPEKVLYPFGFGLSYTAFSIEMTDFHETADAVDMTVSVHNTGDCAGKEVVQLYCEAPQGMLGKPARTLCAFAKTKLLAAGEAQLLTLTVRKNDLASYDDSGVTGHPFCEVLEAGTYRFFLGGDVRSAGQIGTFTLAETHVTAQRTQALAPVSPFQRMKNCGGKLSWEDVPLREYNLHQRVQAHLPESMPMTGNRGFRLSDVADGKISMADFVAQMDENMLCALVRGEGMCSPKVTPGTAGAFGGLSPKLQALGIPAICCADGPSGIRMDCGTQAFLLPSGTCLACSFNETLISDLYAWTGQEMRRNRIDLLLAPGMNLHRHPLNGRNFEYFSEDPLLTGKMAAAVIKGLQSSGVSGTIKHFACNNQEYRRNDAETVVSERALRELYLKGFAIALRESGAFSIMTTYGPVNGLWTSSNYDLLTTILRQEWGYHGVVMTDWWAKGNQEGTDGSQQEVAAMIRSQNDLYMVTSGAENNGNGDNLHVSLEDGTLTIGELQRSAANICRAILRLPAYRRLVGEESAEEQEAADALTPEETAMQEMTVVRMQQECTLPSKCLCGCRRGEYRMFHILAEQIGCYELSFDVRAQSQNDVAQLSMTIYRNRSLMQTISLKGSDRSWRSVTVDLGMIWQPNFYLKWFFSMGGIEVQNAAVRRTKNEKEMQV